ncbi:hypothetical protein BG015_003007 [Linnemannia schmuckeri]|uniref:Uncharacterized protein n=1 Tax=Linnemannia schmuckeri TaxID=64567 RepID=A0A9P5VDD9_9FUNG|nr:hypothetical protein BG015_003007 [Linnemannia schmuckeri]
MGCPGSTLSQDLIKSRVLDGIWKMTRYSFIATVTADAHGRRNITGAQLGQGEIQLFVPIAGNNDHALKQALNPNYLKFRAYKDGTTPLNLCMATQVLPPETTDSSMVTAFSSLALSKSGVRDVPQLIVMVDPSNPKQCPSRWVQFGGVYAKGIDFLKEYCKSGACMEISKKGEQTPEVFHNSSTSQPARSGTSGLLSVDWVGRVFVAVCISAML